MKLKFRTPYTAGEATGEINSGELRVEIAGYISAEHRITNLIQAGQRLEESRRAYYDYMPDDDLNEDRYDPTRDKDFDIVDAQNLSNTIKPKAPIQEPEKVVETPKLEQIEGA